MSEPGSEQQISIPLDRLLEMEALILDALERVPPHRRTEWLRGLLVAGFVSQRRTLREAAGPSSRACVPGSTGPVGGFTRGAFAGWLTQRDDLRPTPPVSAARAGQPASGAGAPVPGRKPFSALQRVIGG